MAEVEVRFFKALEDASRRHEAGVVVLRSGFETGRVFFVGGKIAWATASSVKKNFSTSVVEATGLTQEAVQKIFDDCKRTGKNFGETIIEQGLLDEPGLRRLLLEHVAVCVRDMVHWPVPEPSFKPEKRAYKVNLTFEVPEVLQRVAELEQANRPHPRTSPEAKPAVAPAGPGAEEPKAHQPGPRPDRICPRCGKRHPSNVVYCDADGTRLTDTDGAPKSEDEGPSLVGSVLGSYRVLELLGEGGMGYVYLAEHTRLARKVALKMLRSEYADSAGAVRRFFMEARAVNQIKHENIVEITDFVEDEGGRNYYIMELLEGQSLEDLLCEKRVISARHATAIAIQVASALAAVHEAGIIHRDLKPENIFLCQRGGRPELVKLLDFGVAKLAGPLPDVQMHRTAAGAILGTPEYMSPEQVSGKEVDFRTDIYSLGIIMFEMVTGKKPFTARTFGELVIKHLTVKPPRPSQLKDAPVRLPGALEDLIMQCMEKEPGKRPQGMKEVEERLRKFSGLSSAQLQALDLAAPPPRRRFGKESLAAGGVLLLAAAALAYWLWPRPEPPAPPPAPPPVVPRVEKDPPVAAAPKVEIRFDSVPPGAEVFRPGQVEPLGRTPLKLAFDRSPKKENFEFRLAKYKPVSREVTFEQDLDVLVTLTREKKTPVKPELKTPETPDKPPDIEDTIDPFSE